MATITKKEIIDRITKSTQCKNITVKEIVQQFFEEIISEQISPTDIIDDKDKKDTKNNKEIVKNKEKKIK